MTTTDPANATGSAAVGARVDRGVRPRAWLTMGTLDGKARLNVGECTTNEDYAKVHNAWRWEPLYDQAALDAAVAEALAEIDRLRAQLDVAQAACAAAVSTAQWQAVTNRELNELLEEVRQLKAAAQRT